MPAKAGGGEAIQSVTFFGQVSLVVRDQSRAVIDQAQREVRLART